MGRGVAVVVGWRGRQIVLQGQGPAIDGPAFFGALRVTIAACRSYQRLCLATQATAAEWRYVALLPRVEPQDAAIVVSLRAGRLHR